MRRERPTRALILSAAAIVALALSGSVHASFQRPKPKPLFQLWPTAGFVGKTVDLTKLAENAQRPIVNAGWSFGDGEMSSTNGSVQHTYDTPGTYVVELRLIDEDGQEGIATKTIAIAADAPPVPAIVTTPAAVEAGDTVTFSSVGTKDDADDLYGLPLGYSWEVTGPESFTSGGATFSRALTLAGSYDIELSVTDSNGSIGTATATLTVVANGAYADGPPDASFVTAGAGAPVAGRDAVDFDASGSSDPGGPIATYAWNFGDGATATGVNVSHTFPAAGKHVVSLTVTDADGRTDQTFTTVNVLAGEADIDISPGAVTGADVTFDASGSFVSGADEILWVFGDGWWAKGEVATHRYVLPGTYDVDVYIVNADGDVVTAGDQLVVGAGAPPVVTSGTTPAATTVTTATTPGAPAVAPAAPVIGPPSTPLRDPDAVEETPSGRTIVGSRRADRITGTAYADRLSGGGGNDRLAGRAGRDVLEGGAGNDVIDARDGEVDTIRCGAGRDSVLADAGDRVAKDCESVRRG